MKRTLCILLSLMLAVTGFSWLLVPAAAEDGGSPFVAEDFEGTYSIGHWVFNSTGGMQRWESEPGDYDIVTGHYCNGDGSSRGGNESAEIVRVGSGEPVRYGTQSLKLNYDFTGINGIEGACVGFTAEKEIPGNPTGVGLWFYNPEGGRNFWLRIRVLDGNNNILTLDFTKQREGVNWFGWKYIECDLTTHHGPFKLMAGETIRVMHTYGAYDGMGNYLSGTVSQSGPDGNSVFLGQNTCKGSVYLDNLQFVYGAYTPEPVPEYEVGDTIRFGSYPQSRVTDDATLDALEHARKTWKSYGYYNGTGTRNDGQMTAKDYMQYCDVTVEGRKYRGVKFSEYRPYYTGFESLLERSYQDLNDYGTGVNHWHDCTHCDAKNDEAAHTYGEGSYTWEQTGGAWKATAKHACTVCEWEESETVNATGAQSKAPTCTVNGETTYTATFSNPAFETQTKTVDDIAALDHAYDAVVTEPTCTEDGYTTHTCSRCDDTYTDNETAALGHAFAEWKVVRPAVPGEKGEKQRVCTRCGEAETAEIDELILTSSADGQTGSALTVTVPYAKRGAIATTLSADRPVTYTSSDPKLLQVDADGNVTFTRLCVFCKSATITATDEDGSTAACKVHVEVKWRQYIVWFFLGSLWF